MGMREERFRHLFDSNYRSLTAYALRRTNARADADDVVSETFAVAWRRFDALPQGDHDQRLWLYGVARRILANQRRGVARAQRLALRLESEVDQVAPPDAAIETASDAAAVLHAMRLLDESDQELLRLALWEELRHSDIAKVMGISVPNVAVRLHRAKRKLRARFEGSVQGRAGAGHVLRTRTITTPGPESTR